jgi:chemotaxis family two-component system sensor kinase Cph1
MNDMKEFFFKIFDSNNWPARWHCGLWTPFHGWLYIVSNLVIAAAYFSIPLLLFYLIKKAGNRLPFQNVFWLFVLFIMACGFTHVFDALMFWYPVYRVSALMLAITAMISTAAVIGLYKVLPHALLLKSPAYLEQVIHQRTSELEAANKILIQTNNELEEAKTTMEKLLKLKDEFISVVSHELKTPVTSLKLYTELLSAKGFQPATGTDAVYSKMNGQIQKLTKLINDLLDTTRLDQGLLEYQEENFRLDETLKEIIEQVQLSTAHELIEVEIQPVNVHADKLRIEQVISNILTNAVKFSHGQDKIHISLLCADKMAICKIRDFGKGIPKAEWENVFKKYYRVEQQNSHTFPGLGLGLFVVRNIIENHNGKVWLESEVDKGSTFYFSLPVTDQ